MPPIPMRIHMAITAAVAVRVRQLAVVVEQGQLAQMVIVREVYTQETEVVVERLIFLEPWSHMVVAEAEEHGIHRPFVVWVGVVAGEVEGQRTQTPSLAPMDTVAVEVEVAT